MKINHSKPFFGDEEILAVSEVLRAAYVTNGPKAETLAEKMVATLGKKRGLATQSGTDALTLAFAAIGLREGAKVAVPAYICSAPLDALAALRLEPVPVDIDPDTLAIDIEKASEASNKCQAVLAAHLFGVPAPFYKISDIPVVEDCAQTLGVEVDGRRVGSMGTASICSFYATKLLASGHGGLVAFDDDAIFARAVSLTTHDKREEWEPRLHVLMSDFNAALALAQLEKLPAMIASRRKIAARFAEAMGKPARFADSACSRFIVFTDGPSEPLIEKFIAAGIDAKKPVYKPLYAYLGFNSKLFPNAAAAHERIVSIPIYPAMTEAEIEFIEEFLSKNSDGLHHRMTEQE